MKIKINSYLKQWFNNILILKLREFSSFKQVLLSLSNILNAFHDNI